MKPNDLQKPTNTFLMKIGIPSQVTLIVDSPTNTHFFPRESTVLILCVEFRKLSHLHVTYHSGRWTENKEI